MAKIPFSFNQDSGLLTSHADSGDQNVVLYEQDVEANLDWSKSLANDENYWKAGVKSGFAHYAHVPDLVILDMRAKHGVNFYSKEDSAKVMSLIETHYPYCKTTHKFHSVKS